MAVRLGDSAAQVSLRSMVRHAAYTPGVGPGRRQVRSRLPSIARWTRGTGSCSVPSMGRPEACYRQHTQIKDEREHAQQGIAPHPV
jgi:hypothetical protein